MVTPHGVGKAPDYQGVLQAVHVTIVKWDALLAMHIRAKPPTTSKKYQPTIRTET